MTSPAAHPHHVLSPRLMTSMRAARVCAGVMAMVETASAVRCSCCIEAARTSRSLG